MGFRVGYPTLTKAPVESTPTRGSNSLGVGFFQVSGCTKLEYSTCLKSEMLMTPTHSGLDSWEYWVGVANAGVWGPQAPKFFSILGNLKGRGHSVYDFFWTKKTVL